MQKDLEFYGIHWKRHFGVNKLFYKRDNSLMFQPLYRQYFDDTEITIFKCPKFVKMFFNEYNQHNAIVHAQVYSFTMSHLTPELISSLQPSNRLLIGCNPISITGFSNQVMNMQKEAAAFLLDLNGFKWDKQKARIFKAEEVIEYKTVLGNGNFIYSLIN